VSIYIYNELCDCTPQQIFWWSDQEVWDGWDMWHVCEVEKYIQGFSRETWWKETTSKIWM